MGKLNPPEQRLAFFEQRRMRCALRYEPFS